MFLQIEKFSDRIKILGGGDYYVLPDAYLVTHPQLQLSALTYTLLQVKTFVWLICRKKAKCVVVAHNAKNARILRNLTTQNKCEPAENTLPIQRIIPTRQILY